MKMKIKISYVVLIYFVLASFLYINIDKVPLTHPGNLKASDPFYHATAADMIIDSKQWNYYDLYASLGQEKASNVQPPLYYMIAAILTLFSGVPAWSTLYFLVCLSQSLLIILIYLITKELFEDENTALLAAGLSILPYPVNVWLYSVYIGFWIQVGAYLFIMTFVWLFLRYLKEEESWMLFFMGLCLSSVILLHPQDLVMLLFPVIGLVYVLLKKKKNIIKKFLIFGFVPGLIFLVLLPKFLFVWGAQGGGQYVVGLFGFPEKYYSRSYSGGLVFPDIFFMPKLILILFVIGIFQLILNRKKYFSWLTLTAYFFFITYATPIFFAGPYYFGRARSLTPFFLFPTISYFIVNSIRKIIKKKNSDMIIFGFTTVFVFVSILFSFYGLKNVSGDSYKELISMTKYEHVDINEWNAYVWLHENTKKTDKVFFFGNIYQSELIYSKRISAMVDNQGVANFVIELSQTNETPLSVQGYWAGDTLRGPHIYEKSFFSFDEYSEPEKTLNILDFEYVFLQDLNIPLFRDNPLTIAQVNHVFADRLVKEQGFIPVYNQAGYLILKNGKR